MNWNLVGTRYPSVPNFWNFFGNRYQPIPKIKYIFGYGTKRYSTSQIFLGTRYPALPKIKDFFGTRYPAVPNFWNFLGTSEPRILKFWWVPLMPTPDFTIKICWDKKIYSSILDGVPTKKILPGHSSIPRDIFFFVKKAKTSGRLWLVNRK